MAGFRGIAKVETTDTIGYEAEIRELQTNEPVASVQFLSQVTLLLIGVMVGWLVLGLWQLPLWFVVYYSLVLSEKWLITTLPSGLTRLQFSFVLFLLMFNATVFDLMPLYLWFQDADVLKFGTLAIVTGSTLNIMLTRARHPTILACYLVPNALVFVAIAIWVHVEQGWSPEFFATAVAALAISAYFTTALIDAHFRLKAAASMAEQLAASQRREAIAQLTGGVSHDFNNLLSVISGCLQLLPEAKDEAERKRLIDQALVASEQGSSITKQLLAFGRQAPLHAEPQDTSAVLSDLRVLLDRLLPASVKVRFEVDPMTSWVRADGDMLRSALIHLATNAHVAMPNGGELTVRAHNAPSGDGNIGAANTAKGLVEIVVQDTGIGIRREDLPRVVEPFYSTAEVGKGSGLGLAMANGFAVQSGGSLSLESELGSGTRVSLLLPSIEPAQLPTPRTSPPKKMQREAARILIVDDNEQLAGLIALQLRRDGFDVSLAASGDDAASLLESGLQPDLLLTDVVMPGHLQGPDLAQSLRDRYPNIPVIMMSGYARENARTGGTGSICDLFLEKPVRLIDLREAISKLLTLNDEFGEPTGKARVRKQN